jgi:hypothetical protein
MSLMAFDRWVFGELTEVPRIQNTMLRYVLDCCLGEP